MLLRLPSEYCGPAGGTAKGNESKGTLVAGAAAGLRKAMGCESKWMSNIGAAAHFLQHFQQRIWIVGVNGLVCPFTKGRQPGGLSQQCGLLD